MEAPQPADDTPSPAMGEGSHEATRLLGDVAAGDKAAAERLLPLLYEELRALARSYFKGQPSDHTLQATVLVHEAFLRLVDQSSGAFKDRTHFFAVAATAMRQILTDHARRVRAAKRGGGWQRLDIEAAAAAAGASPGGAPDHVDVLALDEALAELERLDPRKHRIVELRYFGGLSVEEVATVMGVSKRTVEGDWRAARAWLGAKLQQG